MPARGKIAGEIPSACPRRAEADRRSARKRGPRNDIEPVAPECPRQGKTTLAGASRDRLAKPISDRDLWKEFEDATGERVDPASPPTWAELIAARQARRAATSENGTRDAKELREAAEGGKSGSARVAFLLNLDGLPRSNAVTGESPS